MGVPAQFTKALAAASATAICLAQTPAAAGTLLLNGAAAVGSPPVAVLDTGRTVLVTFVGSEVGKNLTITGTGDSGGGISEVIAGTAPGTVVSKQMFKTITSVTISAAAAGAISIGTNATGGTPWVSIDPHRDEIQVGIQVEVVGTVNYTVQKTYDRGGYYEPAGGNWVPAFPSATIDVAAASGVTAGYTIVDPANFWRVMINSGTGTIRVTGTQAGIN